LQHPDERTGAAARTTRRFALVPVGAAPAPLLDALARRIADREPRWRWTEPRPGPTEGDDRRLRATPWRLRAALAIAFAVPLALLLMLVAALRRAD
jgi:hypothetical protein